MSSPDNSKRSDSERPDSAPNFDYAPKWAGDYRQGRARGAERGLTDDERSSLRSDPAQLLRRSLDPEIVHFRQPAPPRRGRFATSAGFILAVALGIVIGLLVTGQFPTTFGEAPRFSSKMTELTSKLGNSKNLEPASFAYHWSCDCGAGSTTR